MSEQRPYRHLCPEADMRDAMTDDEFWAHVHKNLYGLTEDDDMPNAQDVVQLEQLATEPCAECGATGACGYDTEGRPMIHADWLADDPEETL